MDRFRFVTQGRTIHSVTPAKLRIRPMEMIRMETPPELDMPIGEALFTQRAIRRLDPHRPVSDAHLKIVLDAASKAPSGGNTQPMCVCIDIKC